MDLNCLCVLVLAGLPKVHKNQGKKLGPMSPVQPLLRPSPWVLVCPKMQKRLNKFRPLHWPMHPFFCFWVLAGLPKSAKRPKGADPCPPFRLSSDPLRTFCFVGFGWSAQKCSKTKATKIKKSKKTTAQTLKMYIYNCFNGACRNDESQYPIKKWVFNGNPLFSNISILLQKMFGKGIVTEWSHRALIAQISPQTFKQMLLEFCYNNS